MRPLAWGRLLRLSLAPSAVADIAAGLCLGAWGTLPVGREGLLLVLASLCVYHGGMALNDWADREGDARTRPERPIPSGAVRAGSALAVGVLLLGIGAALAWLATADAGVALTAVAACAALYDLAGRGPWRGPLLLALCRGGNLAAGVLLGAHLAVQAGGTGAPNLAWVACALYAGYVLFASRLGRLEDDEDGNALGDRPRKALMLAVTCLLVLPVVALLPLERMAAHTDDAGGAVLASSLLIRFGLPVVLIGFGVERLLREAGRREWTRDLVGRATGMALRRLLVFTGACAMISVAPVHQAWLEGGVVPRLGGWWAPAVGLGIVLVGYPLSFGLRRVFPPT